MTRSAEDGRLYERVSEDLASKIASGAYDIGQRLPSERLLAQTYSVSRPTVREAIIALELDGMVEVRKGSGVYVTSTAPHGGKASETDVGPFELLEARRAIEGEACALAAIRITDEEVEELSSLLEKLGNAGGDIAGSEDADREFHALIARATQNGPMVDAVEALWNARARSPQYRLLSDKAHAAGVVPRFDEHSLILEALRKRDSRRARAAMREHLTKVLESILEVTEVHEIEQARERVAQQRRRYSSPASTD
jgi:DNA-binding FadR family transcriptional regulator